MASKKSSDAVVTEYVVESLNDAPFSSKHESLAQQEFARRAHGGHSEAKLTKREVTYKGDSIPVGRDAVGATADIVETVLQS